MNFIRIIAVALFMGLGVQGCHKDDDPAPAAGGAPPPVGGQVTITAANAAVVAGAAVGAADFLGTLGTALPGIVAVGAVVQPAGGDFSLAALMRVTLTRAARAAEATPVIVTGIVVPFSDPCPISGTVSGTWDDVNNSTTVDLPDTISVTANACEFEPGISANGGINITNPFVSGDWDTPVCQCDAEGTFTFNNLAITEAGSPALTLNGGAIFDASSQSGLDLGALLMGTSLTVDGFAITSFIVQVTQNLATLDYSVGLDALLTSPLLGGAINIDSLNLPSIPLSGTLPADPDTGRMEIGGSGSCLEVTAVGDGVNASLQLFSDSSCTAGMEVGPPTTVTWESL